MPVSITRASGIRPYANISATALIACKCGAPHPGFAPPERDPRSTEAHPFYLAPRLFDDCPACGSPLNTGETRQVIGRIAGFWGSICEALWAFGEALYQLGRKLK